MPPTGQGVWKPSYCAETSRPTSSHWQRRQVGGPRPRSTSETSHLVFVWLTVLWYRTVPARGWVKRTEPSFHTIKRETAPSCQSSDDCGGPWAVRSRPMTHDRDARQAGSFLDLRPALFPPTHFPSLQFHSPLAPEPIPIPTPCRSSPLNAHPECLRFPELASPAFCHRCNSPLDRKG